MTTEQEQGGAIELEASRTLVKSPPELWAECSDPASLSRHLNESFGEIRITRLDPETSVAWEGERASGTVRIEPSGWGTRVTLTATLDMDEVSEEEPVVEDFPEQAPDCPADEHDSLEEEADAKVEETVEDPDPPVVDDPGPIRRRWRRLIFRGWLKPAAVDEPKLRELVPPLGTSSRSFGEAAAPPTFEEEAAGPPTPEEPAPAEALQPPGPEGTDAGAVLAAALDSLGQAHHRPFSRA